MLVLALAASGCPGGATPPAAAGFAGFDEEQIAEILKLSPLPPPPPSPTNAVAESAAAARLGQFLFFETRLSGPGTLSCASCHDPAHDLTSPTPRALGIGGATERNAPSLWNVAYNRWYFWDGRADSLWSQALKPIEHPDEMRMTRAGVVRLLSEDEPLSRAYAAVFGEPPARAPADRVFANAGKAIEAFERRLVVRDSPFDRFAAALRARDEAGLAALEPPARRGLALFVGRGRCTLCHTGPNFTDREFHNIGLDRGDRDSPDPGRFLGIPQLLADPMNVLGAESAAPGAPGNVKVRYLRQRPTNLGEFKTPSLRNVARTGPYMHDGRFATLGDVLGFYSRLDEEPALGHREESLRPLLLAPGEIADLAAFLGALSGPPLDAALGRKPPGPLLGDALTSDHQSR